MPPPDRSFPDTALLPLQSNASLAYDGTRENMPLAPNAPQVNAGRRDPAGAVREKRQANRSDAGLTLFQRLADEIYQSPNQGSQSRRLLSPLLRRVRELERQHVEKHPVQSTLAEQIAVLRDALHSGYPSDPRAIMYRLFDERLAQRHHISLDPGKTFLHAFSRCRMIGERIIHLGLPTSSHSLAQLIEHGFPTGEQWDNLANLDAAAGVYLSGPGVPAGTPAGLSAKQLKALLDPLAGDANANFRSSLARWWDKRQGNTGDRADALLLSAQAWQIAHAQHRLGLLSDMGLQMVMLAQTGQRPDGQAGNLRCHFLDIGGYVSEDIVLLQAGSHPFFQTCLLFAPGNPRPLREYHGLGGLYDGLVADCGEAGERDRLAAHFSGQDREDSYKAGIDTLLRAFGENDNPRSIPLAVGIRAIHGDVFDAIARRRCSCALDELSRLAGGTTPLDDAAVTQLDRRRERMLPDLRPLRLLAEERDATIGWTARLAQGLAGNADGKRWVTDSRIAPARGIAALPAGEQERLHMRQVTLEAAQEALQLLMPDLAVDSARYMRQFIRSRFSVDIVDPDQTYLHRFHPMMRPASHPRTGYWSEINPDRFRFISATPLSELAISNLEDYDADYSIVSCVRKPAAMKAAGKSLVPAGELIAAIHSSEFDFFGHHKAGIDAYYRDHGHEEAALARQLAIFEADVMRFEELLTQEDHALAMRAFGRADADGAPATPRHKVFTLRLERWYSSLTHYTSCNALHIEDDNGRTLLYLPGEDPPLRAFASRADAVNWMMRMDLSEKKQFAIAHFSLDDAEERISDDGLSAREGVVKFLQNSNSGGHIPPRSGASPNQYLTAREDITAAPFEALAQINRQGMIRDAQYLITSPSDLKKRQWRDILSWTPLSPLNLFLDKTASERRETLTEIQMEILFSLLETATSGSTKTMRKLAQGAGRIVRGGSRVPGIMRRTTQAATHAGRLALPGIQRRLGRYFRPPQRLNGKIGYPLSPVLPPHLRRAEAFRIDLPVSAEALQQPDFSFSNVITDLPGRQWVEAESKACGLIDASAAFFRTLDKHPRYAAPPAWPDPPSSVDDFVRRAFSETRTAGPVPGTGIIFGENHTSDATRIAIMLSLPELQKADVKTLYVECVVHDLAGESLEHFNHGGQIGGTLDGMLKTLDTNDSLRNLIEKARECGIRIVGIDSIASLHQYEKYTRIGRAFRYLRPDEPNPYSMLARSEERLRTMNYFALQVIKEEQERNGGTPWIALVGAAHAVKVRGVEGLSTLLGGRALHVKYPDFVEPGLDELNIPTYSLIRTNAPRDA